MVRAQLFDGGHAFRHEVRAFIDFAFTPELQEKTSRQTGVFAEADLARRWHQILRTKGWVAPLWPREYGGPGWSHLQRHIFDAECADAGTPVLPAFGIQLCGPILIARGSEEQKRHFLPKILSGEHFWCQGFSEPQSGSDLASLTLRAERNGQNYVLNGSKIWTTLAHDANWIFLLARTHSDGKPQAGITFLLVELASLGVSIRPIISISGEHELNQVFFDGTRVPVQNRVGGENEGWAVAKSLLEFERGAGDWSARTRRRLKEIKEIARHESGGNGRPLLECASFRHRLTELEIEALAVETTELRVVSTASTGGGPGDAIASMIKVKGSETFQKATELLVDAAGHYAHANQSSAGAHPGTDMGVGPGYARTSMPRYLNSRATTIYGGSSEIQRNILARTALGL